MRTYSVAHGVFTFIGEGCQLQLKHVQRDRYSRIYAYVTLLTADGKGVMALGHGDLTSPRFYRELGTTASRRNSLDPLGYETLLMEAALALQDDPDVTPLAPAPNLVRVEDFVRGVRPPGPSVVAGLLERGHLYSVASKPKVGKTILLLNLAIRVSRGGVGWGGR